MTNNSITRQKTSEHQSSKFWVTCHSFTLALWTQSFAGGVDASAVDADVTGNGAAESSASSMVPPAEDQSAWLSNSCQSWWDTFEHCQTLSDIFRPCQPSCNIFWWKGRCLWWLFCKHWGVFALSLGTFFSRGDRVTMQLYWMLLSQAMSSHWIFEKIFKLVWRKVRWVCRRCIRHLWLRN